MIQTIIGLILLSIPFLLVIRFQDKKKGFFYILSLVIFFHLITAILLQFFGFFNYWLILILNIIVCIAVLIKADFKKLTENIKNLKIDWILVLVLIILIIELSSVHYNYSGKIVDINQNIKEIKNMKYIYPYYSDEWGAVGFIKYSIEFSKLPFVNPLWNNSYFPNPEFAFHSFLSEIFILLNIDVLNNYSLIALFAGILICLLVYFVLRVNGISGFASAIACLSVPYIVNSANLPGIWYLMPLTFGIISLLLNFIFISLKQNKMVIFTSFLILVFYPPLFILSFVSLIFYFLFLEISKKEKIRYMINYFLICLIVVVLISFRLFFRSYAGFDAFNYIFSKLFYFTFTKESIPDYSIWKVIPLWSLIFAVFGLFWMWKEKNLGKKSWLIAPILIGLFYWLLYSFVFWRFIIEYQRIVMVCSILIVVFSGFGVEYFTNYLVNKNLVSKKIMNFVFILIFIGFLINSFSYTQRSNWSELKLHTIDGQIANPAPPANNYLINDDIRLFENVNGKRFIAPAWKGLVIGIATSNYPLESKQSTIYNYILKYNDFMNSDCNSKVKLAKEYKIDYVYSSEFDCSGFKFIGKSKEELVLYETE